MFTLTLVVGLSSLPAATVAAAPKPRIDAFGDPLPAGAVTRIGTIRFRHSDTIYSLAYSPDGKRITSAAQNAFAVWDARTGRRLSLVCFPWRHACPAVSPDGLLVAHEIENNAVSVREAASGKVRCTLPGHKGAVHGLTYSKDTRRLASLDDHGSLFLWDSATGTLVRQWNALDKSGDRGHLAFTPDGKTLVHAAECGLIFVLDTESGKELVRIKPRNEDFGLYGLAVSPDGHTMATMVNSGQRVEFHRVNTGQFIRELPCANAVWLNGATRLGFSPDGKHLLWADGQRDHR
jgi:WD40 repeat protein